MGYFDLAVREITLGRMAGAVMLLAGAPAHPPLLMRTDLFDFELPEERIALHPASPRDAARHAGGAGEARRRSPIAACAICRNCCARAMRWCSTTRASFRAALEGVRLRGELRANVAVNLIERLGDDRWRALARPAKRLQAGDRVHFGHDGSVCLLGALDATVAAKRRRRRGRHSPSICPGPISMRRSPPSGQMPLPPYIAGKRGAEDADRSDYQTIFAAHDGAVAAPTAGLHFTPELMAALDARGVERHS